MQKADIASRNGNYDRGASGKPKQHALKGMGHAQILFDKDICIRLDSNEKA